MHRVHQHLVVGRRSLGWRRLWPLDGSHRCVVSKIHLRRHRCEAARRRRARPRMSTRTGERAHERRRRRISPCSRSHFFSGSRSVNWRIGARVRGASYGTGFVPSESRVRPSDLDWRSASFWASLSPGGRSEWRPRPSPRVVAHSKAEARSCFWSRVGQRAVLWVGPEFCFRAEHN
jgi:hypothetical protein